MPWTCHDHTMSKHDCHVWPWLPARVGNLLYTDSHGVYSFHSAIFVFGAVYSKFFFKKNFLKHFSLQLDGWVFTFNLEKTNKAFNGFWRVQKYFFFRKFVFGPWVCWKSDIGKISIWNFSIFSTIFPGLNSSSRYLSCTAFHQLLRLDADTTDRDQSKFDFWKCVEIFL